MDNLEQYREIIKTMDISTSFIFDLITGEIEPFPYSFSFQHSVRNAPMWASFDIDLNRQIESISIWNTQHDSADNVKPLFHFEYPLLTTVNIILNELTGIDIHPSLSIQNSIIPRSIKMQLDYLAPYLSSKGASIFSLMRTLLMYRESLYALASLGTEIRFSHIYRLQNLYSPHDWFLHWFNEDDVIDDTTLFCNPESYQSSLVNYIKSDYSEGIYSFFCTSWISFITASLMSVAFGEYRINKCKMCGKLFIPENRTDEKYCQFPNSSYNDMPCRDAYKLRDKKRRDSQNIALKIGRRIYMRLYTHNDFDELKQFKDERNCIKKAYDTKKITREQYIQWFKDKDLETKSRKSKQ